MITHRPCSTSTTCLRERLRVRCCSTPGSPPTSPPGTSEVQSTSGSRVGSPSGRAMCCRPTVRSFSWETLRSRSKPRFDSGGSGTTGSPGSSTSPDGSSPLDATSSRRALGSRSSSSPSCVGWSRRFSSSTFAAPARRRREPCPVLERSRSRCSPTRWRDSTPEVRWSCTAPAATAPRSQPASCSRPGSRMSPISSEATAHGRARGCRPRRETRVTTSAPRHRSGRAPQKVSSTRARCSSTCGSPMSG